MRCPHALAVILLTLALLAGCGRRPSEAEAPAGPQGNPVYQCGDLRIVAAFQGSDSLTLSLSDRKLTLMLVPSASGAKFADEDGNQFWTQDGALLMLQGQPLIRCTPNGVKR